MTIQGFEKLGAFYLGRQVDPTTAKLDRDLVLYDSRDLTTHAVIIGMTGSGKTGLGIGLIEEAALDRVPVIAIDPKGDLGNLLLAFPKLRGSDFEPWIDPRQAVDAGETGPEHAKSVAKLWRDGLRDWGQTPDRIGRFVASVDRRIYTPGSTAGTPLSVLGSLEPPGDETIADDELLRELIDATAGSLLALIGLDADPLTSREHICLARIIDAAWRDGRRLALAELIASLQSPPFDRVGVMDLESFFPSKDRFALAMRFNNLLAAPRFEAWLQGDSLDVDRLLFGPSGKPKLSIVSIAHLDDTERMFVVSMLLNQIIAWMRRQAGTSSLRAILYMDEVFGFMPPLGNPASKRLLLTLMKQARAYGLGVVLATQNPVDLDYKGLSNAGTWFLGRLQTARDKQRVIEGLRSASGAAALQGVDLDHMLSSLGKRTFLLHNVHETAPLLFQTRWVMSYLAGPLTREQIRFLNSQSAPDGEAAPVAPLTDAPAAGAPAQRAETAQDPSEPRGEPGGPRPVLPPGVEQRFLPLTGTGGHGTVVYHPLLFGAGELAYSNARLGLDELRSFAIGIEVGDEASAIDWTAGEAFAVAVPDLAAEPLDDAGFGPCPTALARAGNYRSFGARLKRSLREHNPLVLFRSRSLRMTSEPGEAERDFRIRLQEASRVERDDKVAKLKQKFAARVARLEERLRRAQQALDRERQQAQGHTLDTALSFGTAVLGALLGRKAVSVTSANRVGTAVRKAGRIRKEAGDVRRAEETIESVRAELAGVEQELQSELDALHEAYDSQLDELETIEVKPKSTGIHIDLLGIGWVPYRRDEHGRLRRA